MKAAMAMAVLVFLSLSCGDIPIHRDPPLPGRGDIAEMIWETNGGGDIKFEIAPAETGYDIHVSRNAFRVVDTWIRLTVVDRDVYPIVRQIFAGERDLYRDTFKPQNETGTWTSITLVSSSGSQHKIDHIKPGGDLGVLPRFVTRVLDEG